MSRESNKTNKLSTSRQTKPKSIKESSVEVPHQGESGDPRLMLTGLQDKKPCSVHMKVPFIISSWVGRVPFMGGKGKGGKMFCCFFMLPLNTARKFFHPNCI